MQSSNGVLLYFPKVLLIYASPFFKDMFSISEHADDPKSVDNTHPLRMEEDVTTLEELLQSIDPAKPMPPIKQETFSKVLRAAHKYQIEKYITHFAQLAGQEPGCDCGTPNSGSLLSTDPMLVLFLAEQYKLRDLARLALRELVGFPMDKLLASDTGVSTKMWLHLLHLRKERIDQLFKYIERFEGAGRNQISRQSLIAQVRRLHETPRWHSVAIGISDQEETQRAQASFSPLFPTIHPYVRPEDIQNWEREVKELEKRLPPLPQGIL